MNIAWLFPQPSWWYGVARVFDLGAQLDSDNLAVAPRRLDIAALRHDWETVGAAIAEALGQPKKQTP